MMQQGEERFFRGRFGAASSNRGCGAQIRLRRCAPQVEAARRGLLKKKGNFGALRGSAESRPGHIRGSIARGSESYLIRARSLRAQGHGADPRHSRILRNKGAGQISAAHPCSSCWRRRKRRSASSGLTRADRRARGGEGMCL